MVPTAIEQGLKQLAKTIQVLEILRDQEEKDGTPRKIAVGARRITYEVKGKDGLRTAREFYRTAFGTWNDELQSTYSWYGNNCIANYRGTDESFSTGIWIEMEFDIKSDDSPLSDKCELVESTIKRTSISCPVKESNTGT